LVLAAIAVVLAFTVFLPPRSPGPFARDLEAYYGGGAIWNAGGDPWSREIWRVQQTIPDVLTTRDELLPFVGPAASLPLWSLLARATYVEAAVVWTALLALALVLLVAASLGLREPPARIEILAAGVFALAAGPTISDFALGQLALVSAAGVAAALYAFRRGSPWGIVATFVAGLQPNLALPLAVAFTRTRSSAFIALAAAAFVAMTLALGGGFAGLVAYVQLLGRHADAERFVTIQHTVPVILASFGVARPAALAIASGVRALVIAGAVAAAIGFRDRPPVAAAIAIALLPLAMPFFHEHDFVLEIVPAIVLLAVPDPRVRKIASIGAILALVDWFGLAQRQAAQEQIAGLAIATACAIVVYGTRETLRARDLLPLATVVVLLGIAIPVARTWPSPVWPDALSATFRATPGSDASAVWAQEQRASGLDRDVAAWGFLRALPLAGCALLAYAGLRCRRS
jgi:hypothetical protein